MQSLFRMIEAECHSGKILIDGVDIDTLGLDQLRSKLAIIPQVSHRARAGYHVPRVYPPSRFLCCYWCRTP